MLPSCYRLFYARYRPLLTTPILLRVGNNDTMSPAVLWCKCLTCSTLQNIHCDYPSSTKSMRRDDCSAHQQLRCYEQKWRCSCCCCRVCAAEFAVDAPESFPAKLDFGFYRRKLIFLNYFVFQGFFVDANIKKDYSSVFHHRFYELSLHAAPY